MYKKRKKKKQKGKKKKLKSKGAVAQTADKSAPCANPQPTETDTLQGIVC